MIILIKTIIKGFPPHPAGSFFGPFKALAALCSQDDGGGGVVFLII